MYFCRFYNQNYHYCKNRPSTCIPEKTNPQPEPACLFKTVSAGGINLSGPAGTEKEYDLISLSLDFSPKKPTTAVLDFACNITLLNATADIRIQLVKSGGSHLVPVASPAVYRRTRDFSGSDTIFFTVHDILPAKNTSCCYLIKINVLGNTSENSMIFVTDPVLTAIIL